MYVALGTLSEMGMCHIFIYGRSGSTVLFHIFSQKVRFKKNERKIVFWFYLQLSPKNVPF